MQYQEFSSLPGVILSHEEVRPYQAERMAKNPARTIKDDQTAFGVGRPEFTANDVPLPEMFRGILHGCSGAMGAGT